MDSKLKYRQHIAHAAFKGLEAALELKRLRGLSAATARQLFTATVAPTIDYASNVWMHACKDKLKRPVNRVQRMGAQAIVGSFLTVVTSVAEAEAHTVSVEERLCGEQSSFGSTYTPSLTPTPCDALRRESKVLPRALDHPSTKWHAVLEIF